MKIDVDGGNLTSEEIKDAIKQAQEFKNYNCEYWIEQRKELIKELLTLDDEMALTYLKHIKEHRPELLEGI